MPTAAVTINSDGVLDLNGNTQTVATLGMTGGRVSLTGATAALTVTGGVTGTSDSNKNPATISDVGTLNLPTTPTITVNGPNATPAPDMVISAPSRRRQEALPRRVEACCR